MDGGLAGWFYVLSVIVSVLPTIAYVALVWRIDRYEKEPIRLLVTAFFWGAVPAVILASGVETAFDAPLARLSGAFAEVASSSLVAPPVEEILKGLALWRCIGWRGPSSTARWMASSMAR